MSEAIATAQAIQGPVLAGVFLNLILLGISITQTYFFFNGSTKDKPWIKKFVVLIFFLDIFNSVFGMVYMYDILINHNGDVSVMTKSTWAFIIDPISTALIAGVVQMFFGWRVKLLTGSTIAAVVIWFFSTVQFLAGIGTGIAGVIVPEFLEFRQFAPITVIWLAGSAVCDVLITLMLVLYLRKQKTGYAYTDFIVDRIIRLTVQTGMISSLVAIINVILYLASPKSYDLIFNYMLAKLYTNSLLSSLNARKTWADSSGSRPSRDPPSRAGGSSSGRRPEEVINLAQLGKGHTRPQVFVAIESHQVVDESHTFDGKVDYPAQALDGGRSNKPGHEQEVNFIQSFASEVRAP